MPAEKIVRFEARGAVAKLFHSHDPEIVIDGPAGTGKSRGVLEKLNACAWKYQGFRGLILRKTRASLTNTGMRTFKEHVLVPGDGVEFHTPSQSFVYPGKDSTVTVGGLDNATKVMSSEYDVIFVQEATEATLDDWEKVTLRTRNFKMPYQQAIMDCNPSFPKHWIRQRWKAGKTRRFKSIHQDNAAYYDSVKKEFTEKGKLYMRNLDALTGVRYKRLKLGLWVAQEGTVYEEFDPDTHIIDRFPIPEDWPAIWVVDFGYTNPFVWQCWRMDEDGRLYREHEIYRTRTKVSDHAKTIKALGLKKPDAIICDHDAEDRDTFESVIGLKTKAAFKAVSPGIQAVALRLRVQDDGYARMYWLKDSLVGDQDTDLLDKHFPVCSEEEFDSYIWDIEEGKKIGEKPVKKFDHGKDAERYVVAYVDGVAKKATAGVTSIDMYNRTKKYA